MGSEVLESKERLRVDYFLLAARAPLSCRFAFGRVIAFLDLNDDFSCEIQAVGLVLLGMAWMQLDVCSNFSQLLWATV